MVGGDRLRTSLQICEMCDNYRKMTGLKEFAVTNYEEVDD
jgi:hypothetical protein